MIRVTIDLVSAIGVERDRTLGVLEISNDGTGTSDVGNYIATLHAEYTPPSGRSCRVRRFRWKKQSVWSLVGAALKQMGHTKHT